MYPGLFLIVMAGLVPAIHVLRAAPETMPATSAGMTAWIALSRLPQRVLGLGVGPVEPVRQRFHVGALDGRAAPDAQARRCVPIGIDVEGDAFLVERGRQPFDESRLRFRGKPGDRRIDDLQTNRCVGANGRIDSEEV